MTIAIAIRSIAIAIVSLFALYCIQYFVLNAIQCNMEGGIFFKGVPSPVATIPVYTWENYIRVNPYPLDMGPRGYFQGWVFVYTQ